LQASFSIEEKKKKIEQSKSSLSIALESDIKLKDIIKHERLGGGNFGDVYRGTWKDSVDVALK